MSRLQLAKRIDRSHTYMWRRLSGETAFDLDDLQKIAAVLGVSVSDLMPKANTFRKSRDPLAARVVATGGEDRIPRQRTRTHRPGRAVQQTRPVDRPATAATAGR